MLEALYGKEYTVYTDYKPLVYLYNYIHLKSW